MKIRFEKNMRLLTIVLIIPLIFSIFDSCSDRSSKIKNPDTDGENVDSDNYNPVYSLLVLPKNPQPGEPFRILATGGINIGKAEILVNGPAGNPESGKKIHGAGIPYWRIDDFSGSPEGNYRVTLAENKKEMRSLEFRISLPEGPSPSRQVWKTRQSWDSSTEALYSAWISVLFHDCDERSSWTALDKVTQNQELNFLYNYLSQGEDDPGGKTTVIMEPDCADNPFYLRAYFAWKLGLPFGFHICDRGGLGRNPKTGRWITNEIPTSKNNPVLAFNAFLRRLMDGVHSGTARAALEDENSDYYPVSLERSSLRPGVVFADPYGHTLIIVKRQAQTKDEPGKLLAVDAQPDGTVGIKRFWKGNFLFNTKEVIGEPGFKAFRPIEINAGKFRLLKNEELTASAGFNPFSLQQKKLESETFYLIMEKVINPKLLDPETALLGLIESLHEQLMVRVTSVANGEEYLKSRPGLVIPMPSSASGIFQAGGLWEDFSTPNRDLRLLIAMDQVLGFPERVAVAPGDFKISGRLTPEQTRETLQSVLNRKCSEFSISYTRSDGSLQRLTVLEILKRKDAFEMAYNPNDCCEIRWGGHENSNEATTCRRKAPAWQVERMRSFRKWFQKRVHPPT